MVKKIKSKSQSKKKTIKKRTNKKKIKKNNKNKINKKNIKKNKSNKKKANKELNKIELKDDDKLKNESKKDNNKDKNLKEKKSLKKRCDWVSKGSISKKLLIYHDTKWCKPIHNDQELFAMLNLELFQAGLNWATILNKEENFRQAFDHFNPEIIAKYDDKKIEELMNNEGIIRNNKKINAVITNAKAFLKLKKEFGSFDKYIWGFTNGKIIDNHLKSINNIQSNSPLSKEISKDLKKRGFNFVGPTIIYSYLQAVGIINDHIENCEFR